MPRIAPLLALYGLLQCTSCQLQPTQAWEPTARVTGLLSESYEAQVSALGYVGAGDTEYDSFEFAFGAHKVEVDDDGSSRPRELAEVVIGSSSFGDVDAVEVSAGGRFYTGGSDKLLPFLSIHSVNTTFDDVGGITLGSQLGLRVGGGVAFFLSERVFLDLGLDHTFPLLAAESNSSPVVETELEGTAIRIGFGFSF